MCVNSAFKGFNNRLAVGAGTAIVMLAIFITTASFGQRSDRELLAKQTNLIIRQMGHRLLLQAGDSTSRVLPVAEINEGTFLLKFENEFVFNHDSLMMLSHRLLPETQFPSGYTVTVHECMGGAIVYGFQVNHTSPDIMACRGRKEPSGCYTIEMAFPDLYKNLVNEENVTVQNKADLAQPTEKIKSSKVDPEEAISKQEEITSVEVGPKETIPKLAEAKSVEADPKKAIPKPEELEAVAAPPKEANIRLEGFKTTLFGYPLINLGYGGILLLGVALIIGRFRKSLVPVSVQNQDHAIMKESVPEVPALGKFLFDVKDQRLLLGSEVISLTDKECRILELLNKNFGQLIPRETLMEKVWISEGVITGRSLDMFVSKLRKKLSSDPELRISNVHGKGYKLEIPGTQIFTV
jgi:DNA-binding winged helix-turn-helix (wHTH) protein